MSTPYNSNRLALLNLKDLISGIAKSVTDNIILTIISFILVQTPLKSNLFFSKYFLRVYKVHLSPNSPSTLSLA